MIIFLFHIVVIHAAPEVLEEKQFPIIERKQSADSSSDTEFLVSADDYEDVSMEGLKRLAKLTEHQKKEALIQVFKMKLLELLGVDNVPSPSEVNVANVTIPEAILKQFKILEDNKNNRIKSGQVVKYRLKSWHSRALRDKPNVTEIRIDQTESHEEDEASYYKRFNSSIVDQVTLVTNKIHDKSTDSWCDEKIFNNKKQELKPLDCFKLALTQAEFHTATIQSAKIYFKLDKMNQSIYKSSGSMHKHAYVYIEANGYLVKRFDLLKLLNVGDNIYGYEEPFKHVEIKDILREVLASDHDNDEYAVKAASMLKIRFLIRDDLLKLNHEAGNGLITSNENLGLNVKFGDALDSNRDKVKHYKMDPHRHHHIHHDRIKRDEHSANGSRAPVQHKNATKQFKATKDCDDLRRAGYTSSNLTCCRETIKFSIEQLGWSHWILSPKVIEYKYCRGGCLSKYLMSTRQAMFATVFTKQLFFFILFEAGVAPRYDNTHIIYKMFELSNAFEASHCCNIYDYETEIPFIYGSPPNYLTKMVSLNAKNCLCS